MNELHRSVLENNWRKVRDLLEEKADPNAKDAQGQTPLHIAAGNKNATLIVGTLLQYHANPNARDEKGQTPLHISATKGHTEIVNALLHHRKKADVNAKDNHNSTPLHEAVRAGCLPTVSTLLANGATPDIEDEDGKTADQLTESFAIKTAISYNRNQSATHTQKESLVTPDAEDDSFIEGDVVIEDSKRDSRVGVNPLLRANNFCRKLSIFEFWSKSPSTPGRFPEDDRYTLIPTVSTKVKSFEALSIENRVENVKPLSKELVERLSSVLATAGMVKKVTASFENDTSSKSSDNYTQQTGTDSGVTSPSSTASVSPDHQAISDVEDTEKAFIEKLVANLNKSKNYMKENPNGFPVDYILKNNVELSRFPSVDSDDSIEDEEVRFDDDEDEIFNYEDIQRTKILNQEEKPFNLSFPVTDEHATPFTIVTHSVGAGKEGKVGAQGDGDKEVILSEKSYEEEDVKDPLHNFQSPPHKKQASWLKFTALSVPLETNAQDCLAQVKNAEKQQNNTGGLEVLAQTRSGENDKLLVFAQLKNSTTTEAQTEDRHSLLEMTKKGKQQIWRQCDQKNLSMQEQALILAGVLLQQINKKEYVLPTVTIGSQLPPEKQTWLYCYLNALKAKLGVSLKIVCQTSMVEEIEKKFSEMVQPQLNQWWEQLNNGKKDTALLLNDCINKLLSKGDNINELNCDENREQGYFYRAR